MENLKLSTKELKSLKTIRKRLRNQYSIQELEKKERNQVITGCSGNCHGSCVHKCGGCGGSSCRGGLSLF